MGESGEHVVLVFLLSLSLARVFSCECCVNVQQYVVTQEHGLVLTRKISLSRD